MAFVVPATDAPGEDDTHRRPSTSTAATRLARFKHPARVVVVGDLPHSATGKVAKGRLRALARGEALNLGLA